MSWKKCFVMKTHTIMMIYLSHRVVANWPLLHFDQIKINCDENEWLLISWQNFVGFSSSSSSQIAQNSESERGNLTTQFHEAFNELLLMKIAWAVIIWTRKTFDFHWICNAHENALRCSKSLTMLKATVICTQPATVWVWDNVWIANRK